MLPFFFRLSSLKAKYSIITKLYETFYSWHSHSCSCLLFEILFNFEVVVNDSLEEEEGERESKKELGEPFYRQIMRGWSIAKFTKGRHFSKRCWPDKPRENSENTRAVREPGNSLNNVSSTLGKGHPRTIPRLKINCCADDVTVDRSGSSMITAAVSDSSIHKKSNNCDGTARREALTATLLPID